jgi:integrase/recombinase XerC
MGNDLDLESFKATLRQDGLRDRSIVEYERHVRRALAAGGDLAAPLRAAGSASAWQGAFAAIVRWARFRGMGDVRERLRAVAPAPRTAAKETEPVPEADWQRVVEAAGRLGDPLRGVLEVLLLSGLRINDVLGVTREQASSVLAQGIVRIEQKGGRLREWAPPAEVVEPLRRLLGIAGWRVLQDLIAPPPLSWKTAQGRLREVLAAVCRSAGVAYANPHRFRHTMATALNERDVDARTMQRVLGHASLQTTMRYVHPSAKRQREAVAGVLRQVLRKPGPRGPGG